MNPNQEFHELIGKCWHEFHFPRVGRHPWENCIHCGEVEWKCKNPDYAADPRLVLRGMMATKYRDDFYRKCLSGLYPSDLVERYILDTTGLLRDAAIKFLKEMKDEPTT